MVSNISADSQGRSYVVHRGPKPLRRLDLDGNYLGSVADPHLTQLVNYDLTVDLPRPIGEDFWLHGLHVDSWITFGSPTSDAIWFSSSILRESFFSPWVLRMRRAKTLSISTSRPRWLWVVWAHLCFRWLRE